MSARRGLCVVLIAAGCGPAAPPPEPPAAPAQERGAPAAAPRESLGSIDRAFALPEPPPREFARLAPNEDTALLDAALDEIFSRPKPAASEKTALRILAYVAQKTKLESAAARTGSEVLREGRAYCFGMARAYVALCRRAGLRARMNSLHNFHLMPAHNMAEVYYGGAWHLVDPTYATFFYTRSTCDGEGAIRSLRDVFANGGGGVHVFQVARDLWTGKYAGYQEPAPLDPEARYGQYPFTLAEFYAHLFKTAFPVVPGDYVAASFPLDVDLREANEHWIGRVDGDVMDVQPKTGGKTARYTGGTILGQAHVGAAFHTVTLRIAEPGRFTLTYHVLGGRHDRIGAVALKNVVIGGITHAANTWTLTGYAQADPALLLIHNRHYATHVDAVHVSMSNEQ